MWTRSVNHMISLSFLFVVKVALCCIDSDDNTGSYDGYGVNDNYDNDNNDNNNNDDDDDDDYNSKQGRMMKKGSMMVSYQPLGRIPNFFRSIISNQVIIVIIIVIIVIIIVIIVIIIITITILIIILNRPGSN